MPDPATSRCWLISPGQAVSSFQEEPDVAFFSVGKRIMQLFAANFVLLLKRVFFFFSLVVKISCCGEREFWSSRIQGTLLRFAVFCLFFHLYL